MRIIIIYFSLQTKVTISNYRNIYKAIDSETVEVVFDNRKKVIITDFSPSPLEKGENEIKFKYDGVIYEGIVAYGITNGKYFDFDRDINAITGYRKQEAINDLGSEKASNIVIPDKIDGVEIEKISDDAFASNDLKSVVISDSVTEIGRSAFSSNQLTSVVIPDSVIFIRDRAFDDDVELIGCDD